MLLVFVICNAVICNEYINKWFSFFCLFGRKMAGEDVALILTSHSSSLNYSASL